MIVIAGGSHPNLAAQLAAKLRCEYVFADTQKFADQELKVYIEANLCHKEVIIVQSTSQPANDNLMELLLIADTAKRAGCGMIKAVIPYFGYGRQDKPSYVYGPISASLVARLIETSGINQAVTIDIHSKQAEGFFKIDIQNLNSVDIFISKFKDIENPIVVSPDVGGLSRAKLFAEKLESDVAIINKNRNASGECFVSSVIGEVKGKNCIIVDDIVDTGSTLYKSANLLIGKGANSVSACITHAVLSNNSVKQIEQLGLSRFLITDTIHHEYLPSFIEVLPINEFLANALSFEVVK
jgi:ribose-phosphate pyrophosphokinase